MFQRNYTRVTDYDTIFQFLQDHNFGIIVSDNPLKITHLPFVIHKSDHEGQFVVEAHFARANEHWESIDKKEVVLIFTGPHGYISPRVYTTPGVPTWNYSVVHLYGTAEIIQDPSDHIAIIGKLVNQYEKDPVAWNIDQLDPMVLQRQYQNTVSFRVVSHRVDAKFKLSQNKSEEDRVKIINQLQSGNSQDKALAEFMIVQLDE